MKLSTMKIMNNAAIDLTEMLKTVETAENIETARKKAQKMSGYLDCLYSISNLTVECEFEEVLIEWKIKLLQAMVIWAMNVKDYDLEEKYLKARDELRESLKDYED